MSSSRLTKSLIVKSHVLVNHTCRLRIISLMVQKIMDSLESHDNNHLFNALPQIKAFFHYLDPELGHLEISPTLLETMTNQKNQTIIEQDLRFYTRHVLTLERYQEEYRETIPEQRFFLSKLVYDYFPRISLHFTPK